MSILRSCIKKWLLQRGIVMSRPPGQFNVFEYKLERMKQRGLVVKLAVDGGAADGGWAVEFKRVFPEALILCIEPRDEVQERLRQVAANLGGIHISQTLVGAHEGVVSFNKHAEQSSILPNSDGENFGECVQAPITTLDRLIAQKKLPWPDMIKLDLQGAELQCLDGATECLTHAEVVVLEVSFIPFQEGCPLIGEVIPYLKQRGFRCYDISGLWHRPLDGALAQGDFIFVREGSQLIANSRWNKDGTWTGWSTGAE